MLLLNALIKYIAGVVLVGVMVFLPAGKLNYPLGWLFMGLLFIPMLIMGTVMLIKAPALLEKRLDSKEKRGPQSKLVAFTGLVFIASFAVSGLDARFGLSHMPVWAVVAASVVFLCAYAMYAEVMRENAYLSRTVKVEKDQQLIDTGLYGIIRHPMYTAAIFMFVSVPVILGSVPGLCIMLLFPAAMVMRLTDEEKLLEKELRGYTEYKSKVRYRLIPHIW